MSSLHSRCSNNLFYLTYRIRKDKGEDLVKTLGKAPYKGSILSTDLCKLGRFSVLLLTWTLLLNPKIFVSHYLTVWCKSLLQNSAGDQSGHPAIFLHNLKPKFSLPMLEIQGCITKGFQDRSTLNPKQWP